MKINVNSSEFKPFFEGTQGKFQSPFVSRDSNNDPFFTAVLQQANPKVLSKQGATAWQQALTRATKGILTSDVTGGLPVNEIADIMWTKELPGGATEIKGLFAEAVFPAVAKPEALQNVALQVGLEVAVNALSAVPIAGPVLEAVVGIAKLFANIFKRPNDQVQQFVPWHEYSRDIDEDLVNAIIIAELNPGVDWTKFFEPALDPGATVRPAEGGPGRYVAASFGAGPEPLWTGGFGYMPGTQRMVHTLQIARVIDRPGFHEDALTNTGEFLPSSTQWGTVAWGMVERYGPNMYKVQASKLISPWEDYWGAYFEGLLERKDLAAYKDRQLQIAQAIGKYLTWWVPKGHSHSGSGLKDNVEFIDPQLLATGDVRYVINDKIFSTDNDLSPGRQFLRPDQTLTTPALKRLRERQLAALSNSLVCAYVRPRQVQGLPAFAAFRDPGPPTKSGYDSFGEQLRAECDRVREILLTHPARYGVSDRDAIDVDPVFGQQLKDSKGLNQIPPVFSALPPLDQEASPGPPAEEPNGGFPGDKLLTPSKPKKPTTSKKFFYGALIGVGGYLGYKAYKGELGDVKRSVTDTIDKIRGK